MERIVNIYKSVFTIVLMFAGAVFAHAQNVVFSAAASAAKMGIQDQVQVQYTIKDAQNLQTLSPKEEIKNDFHIVGGPYQSQSSQVSNINGKLTQSFSITITYVLQPKRKGKLTIPAAIATASDGETYQSNSVPIEVVDGSLAQQQQQRQRRYDPFADDPFEAILRQRQQMMQQHQ